MTRLPRVGGTRAKGQVSTPDHGAPRRSTPVLRKLGLVFLVERRSSCWADTTAVGHPVPIPPLDCDPLDHNLLEIRSWSPRFQPNKRPRTTFLPTAARRTLKLATYVGALAREPAQGEPKRTMDRQFQNCPDRQGLAAITLFG
jgi:hypothetical protein